MRLIPKIHIVERGNNMINKKQLNNTPDLKGLFFIVKGQYQKDNDPSGVCISGYDPDNKNTNEWYQLKDRITFHTIACGGNLEKVLKGVYTTIKKFKTQERYFRYVCKITAEDYYSVHYKGKTPKTSEEIVKTTEGRSSRVSPVMKELYKKVFDTYGDYYEEEISVWEDKAYEDLKGDTLFSQSKKLVRRTKLVETPKEETSKKTLKKKEEETPTPPKTGTLKTPKKFGNNIKRLSL